MAAAVARQPSALPGGGNTRASGRVRPPSAQVVRLMEMSFSRAACEDALGKAKGDVNNAMAFLVGEDPDPPPAPAPAPKGKRRRATNVEKNERPALVPPDCPSQPPRG